jgi:hypothetical protein
MRFSLQALGRAVSVHRPIAARPRRLHGAAQLSARKDSQDRQSMDTRATEYTRSGTDDEVAHTDAAFDASRPRPEDAAGADGDASLDVSPANADVSRHKVDGPEKSAGADATSGRKGSGQGRPAKAKRVPGGGGGS